MCYLTQFSKQPYKAGSTIMAAPPVLTALQTHLACSHLRDYTTPASLAVSSDPCP